MSPRKKIECDCERRNRASGNHEIVHQDHNLTVEYCKWHDFYDYRYNDGRESRTNRKFRL